MTIAHKNMICIIKMREVRKYTSIDCEMRGGAYNNLPRIIMWLNLHGVNGIRKFNKSHGSVMGW